MVTYGRWQRLGTLEALQHTHSVLWENPLARHSIWNWERGEQSYATAKSDKHGAEHCFPLAADLNHARADAESSEGWGCKSVGARCLCAHAGKVSVRGAFSLTD